MVDEVGQRPSRDPRRIVVAGVSGSGKTTLAARIAERLGVEHVELDGLHHGPGWVRRPEFLDDVHALVAREAWVTEWQYADARPILLAHADLMVWLDLATWRVMGQVVRRTVRRRLGRQVLWNGNTEGPLWTFFTDREHIVRWAWQTRHKYDRLDERVAAERADLPVVRLRSHREAAQWLASL